MNRVKLLLSGLIATLSLTAAAPVFAAPYQTTKVETRVELNVDRDANQHNETLNTKGPQYQDKLDNKGQYNEGRENKPREDETSRQDAKLESKVLALVNEARARYGLTALRQDSRATVSARQASTEASREHGFGRISTTESERLRNQGVNASYQMSETTRLLKDSNSLDATARQIVQGWLKDTKQSRVLLDKNLTYVGVGAVTINGKSAVTLDAFGLKPIVQPKPAPHCD